MNKEIIILTILVMACSSPNIYAEEEFVTFDQLKSKLQTIKNPFQSKLPQKKEPVVELKSEPKIEPTKDNPIIKILGIKKEPPAPPPLPIPSFEVTGVIWDTDRPQAIMNGQIVNLGDTIVGVKITDIQKTAIHGFFDGRNITIKP